MACRLLVVVALIWLIVCLATYSPVTSQGAECVTHGKPVAHNAHNVVTPTVVAATTVAVPVAVPYALFQFVGTPTVYAPVAVAASQVATVAATPAVQAAVAATPATQAQAPEQSAFDKRLEAIEAALARLAGQASPAANAGSDDGPPVVQRSATTQTPSPGALSGQARSAQQQTQQQSGGASVGAVAAVLQKHCAQCHTGNASRGDAILFDTGGVFNPNMTPDEIWASVKKDRMPKTPAKLSPEEKALVRAWAGQ